MPGTLDLSRRPHRSRARRARRAVCGAAAVALIAVCAARCGAVWSWQLSLLPARADTALAEHFAPGYAARLAALQQENAALRGELAAAQPLLAENAALRTLAGCAAALPAAVRQPCTVTARSDLLTVSGQGLCYGTALLDPNGRLAAMVVQGGEHSARAAFLGSAACCVSVTLGASGAIGTVQRVGGALWVTGLPTNCTAAAGDPVATLGSELCPAGLWVGRLAGAPQPDRNGLTARALLTDTADPLCTVYFSARNDP